MLRNAGKAVLQWNCFCIYVNDVQDTLPPNQAFVDTTCRSREFENRPKSSRQKYRVFAVFPTKKNLLCDSDPLLPLHILTRNLHSK